MNSSTHSGSDGHGYPSCSGYVGRCPTCLEKLSRDQLISMLEHGWSLRGIFNILKIAIEDIGDSRITG